MQWNTTQQLKQNKTKQIANYRNAEQWIDLRRITVSAL